MNGGSAVVKDCRVAKPGSRRRGLLEWVQIKKDLALSSRVAEMGNDLGAKLGTVLDGRFLRKIVDISLPESTSEGLWIVLTGTDRRLSGPVFFPLLTFLATLFVSSLKTRLSGSAYQGHTTCALVH